MDKSKYSRKEYKLNRRQINSFWKRRTQVADPLISTHFKIDDANIYDFKFVKKYLKPHFSVLDMGCGNGIMAERVAKLVKQVKGIDRYQEFIDRCPKLPNLVTQVADVLQYTDKSKYDVVLLFGVLNYFDENDSQKIYRKVFSMLRNGGTLIVKHACGVNGDVFVDSYSEAIKDHYQAIYKHVKTETALLNTVFPKVTVHDIYPSHLNHWENTHYYAFVAQK